jgi:hypothetical protein
MTQAWNSAFTAAVQSIVSAVNEHYADFLCAAVASVIMHCSWYETVSRLAGRRDNMKMTICLEFTDSGLKLKSTYQMDFFLFLIFFCTVRRWGFCSTTDSNGGYHPISINLAAETRLSKHVIEDKTMQGF